MTPFARPDLTTPGLTLVHGRAVLHNDHGTVTLEKWQGKVVTDLCAALA